MDEIIPVSIALTSSILEGENYHCRLCEAVFPRIQNLIDHIKIYHSFPHHCPHCESSFSRKLNLNEHIRNFHYLTPNGVKKNDTVHEGQKPSSSTSQRMTKGQKSIRPVRCYVCKLDFSEYGEYKQHMISFHQFTKTLLEKIFSNEEVAQKEKNTIKGQITSEGNCLKFSKKQRNYLF